MKYDFYRCASDNCGALVTKSQVEKQGKCKVCGSRKVRAANFYGWNLPKIYEWPLVLLGLR